MRISVSLFLIALCSLTSLLLCGCVPAAQSQSEEQKEPHFLVGKSRVNTLDFEGAIQAFEKALEVNPQSASAHFELAWLFEQKKGDPAAAIYHYEHYLKLRPGADNLETVKQHILACKQELARTVSLGPVSEKVQKDLDQLTQDNKRLTEENKKLHEDLDKWIAYANRLQTLTNRPLPAAEPGANAASSALVRSKPASSVTSATASRSYTIKPGDTPIVIAKRYGIRLEALLAANPRLDARRLRVGQSLVIPSLETGRAIR